MEECPRRIEESSEHKQLEEKVRNMEEKLRDANRELNKLNQLKSDFITTVSHELRTPLSVIKEGISLVLDRIPGKINKKQERILASAKYNIDRLARIVANLLDMSKIEAGVLKLKKERVDLTALIKNIVSFFEPKIKEKGLGLKVNTMEKKIDVYADGDMITQVLTNLIGNALKFTEKGHIEISARELPDIVECFVKDTGSGISKEDMPNLFTRFQQSRRRQRAQQGSIGLGLYIAKGVMELHNGRIWAQSEPGKGTKVIFTLPKYNAKEEGL